MTGWMRFRPIGWLTAVGTFGAMAATFVLATPGGAATGGEQEVSSSFEAACIVGPGVINVKSTIKVALHGTLPTEVNSGEEFSLRNASSTITSPVELSETFHNLGVNEVTGKVTQLIVEAIGAEPKLTNVAKPPGFPEGLPFVAAVEAGKPAVFNVPSKTLGETGLTYTAGSWKVTATTGGSVELRFRNEAGFAEPEPGAFKSTGEGVISEVEGRNSGSHVLGPLTVACNSPSLKLASIPVRAEQTTTRPFPGETPGPSKTTTTTTMTTTTPSTTSTSGSCHTNLCPRFEHWKLKGSLTDRKLGETITLPEGCTFTGEAEVPGAVEGNTACPPFKATIKIFGLLPATLGLTLTESEPVKGTITQGKEGKLLFKATAKDNIGITSLSLFGLTIPTSCKTAEPVVFPLETEEPASSLASGATFHGETTLPVVQCGGGFLGSLFGHVMTVLFSGPNNPFTLTIEP